MTGLVRPNRISRDEIVSRAMITSSKSRSNRRAVLGVLMQVEGAASNSAIEVDKQAKVQCAGGILAPQTS